MGESRKWTTKHRATINPHSDKGTIPKLPHQFVVEWPETNVVLQLQFFFWLLHINLKMSKLVRKPHISPNKKLDNLPSTVHHGFQAEGFPKLRKVKVKLAQKVCLRLRRREIEKNCLCLSSDSEIRGVLVSCLQHSTKAFLFCQRETNKPLSNGSSSYIFLSLFSPGFGHSFSGPTTRNVR